MKYQVRITYPSGQVSYLIHRDRTAWRKATAQKYLNQFVLTFGLMAELEEI